LALTRVGPKAGQVVRALVRALDEKEPAEVRQFAAEALDHAEDAVNEVMPELLAVLKNDPNRHVRQRVAMALRFARDFEKGGAAKALEAVLDETDREGLVVRYDAARVLGHVMQDKAPRKAVEVLADMLKDTTLYEYKGTDPTLRKGDESVKGGTGVKENRGGD